MLNKLLEKLESEAKTYAVDAIEHPGKGTSFEYGKHHGYLKALSHFKQWVDELLEEEDDEKE
jgi:hypothetical protein